jgi:tRNA 2-thiocytidine biosynthesis protein TtcA
MIKNILSGQVNRRIGRALCEHSMLDDGDHVLVAVSGGIDSMVLAWVLRMWQDKAPINYSLRAVTIDTGFHLPEQSLRQPGISIETLMERLDIPYSVVKGEMSNQEDRTCFSCARQRRNRLFELAREYGCNKIALGHHKDDLIETLLLNILYSGNISTMIPRQDLFNGRLSLIRPLAYLEKDDVSRIAERLGIIPVDNLCPLSGDTRRETVRRILAGIYHDVPKAKSSIFSAMGNVRKEYLL